jgi:glucosamine--fructose-6-phosphate aminotransferase (isomerizing)
MSATWNEIEQQGASWRTTLNLVHSRYRDMLEDCRIDERTHFLFIGCGTSYYLALSAARLTQQATGCPASAVPASEVFLAPDATLAGHGRTMAVLISRSGDTSEILLAAEQLRTHAPEIRTLGITCSESGEMIQTMAEVMVLPHAAEESVVMTKSFTSMLLALQAAAAIWGGREDWMDGLARVPDHFAACAQAGKEFGERLAGRRELTQHIFLGLGPYGGLALEGMLKLKEMTQTSCEAYNPLEFRHGPISIVGEGTSVVLLAQGEGSRYLHGVAGDVRAFGGHVSVLAPDMSGAYEDIADTVVRLPAGLSDWCRSVLYLPALQYFAHFTAVQKGLDPDRPRNLGQVVMLSA